MVSEDRKQWMEARLQQAFASNEHGLLLWC